MYLIVFSSRAAALRVKARLDASGIFAQAVSTPIGLGKSCGISLKVWGAPPAVLARMCEGAPIYCKSGSAWTLAT